MLEARACKAWVTCCVSIVGPSEYDAIEIEGGYKIDLLVEDCVGVELNVVADSRRPQSPAAFQLANKELGLIINFMEFL